MFICVIKQRQRKQRLLRKGGIICFGDHEGERLSEVQRDYLEWVTVQTKPRHPLKGEAVAELRRREDKRWT